MVATESDEARITPLPPGEWPEEMRAAIAAIRPSNPRQPMPPRDPSRPKGLNVLGTFARYPALAQAFHTLTGHVLFGTALAPRERELLILRVATVRGSTYEWKQHVVLATDAGITSEEIDRIAAGADHESWSPLDRAMLGAVDELLADAKVAGPTWEVLASELDVEQLMDLVFTVGAYDLLAMALRSFGVPIDDDLG